jgi:glycosyltransferase involved in cell wall biosynthesis
MKSLGFLVTVFNEHKTVEEAITQVININYPNKKILVIDNGSTDSSKEKIKNFDQKDIKFILREKNEGFGKSIQEGIKLLDTDYIYIQYSDLEYDHLRSLDMLEYAIKNELDVVLGSRLLVSHMMSMSLIKKIRLKPSYIATIVCTYLINKFYKKNFTDIIGGKLYKRSSVIGIPINSFSAGFDFEFISRIIKSNLKVGEISIDYKPRANHKEKKIKPYHMINALYEIFKVKIFN